MSSVQAMGKTVVGMRKNEANLELKAVHIPDHLDILATHPSGATIHFLVSTVLGMQSCCILHLIYVPRLTDHVTSHTCEKIL